MYAFSPIISHHSEPRKSNSGCNKGTPGGILSFLGTGCRSLRPSFSISEWQYCLVLDTSPYVSDGKLLKYSAGTASKESLTRPVSGRLASFGISPTRRGTFHTKVTLVLSLDDEFWSWTDRLLASRVMFCWPVPVFHWFSKGDCCRFQENRWRLTKHEVYQSIGHLSSMHLITHKPIMVRPPLFLNAECPASCPHDRSNLFVWRSSFFSYFPAVC